MCSVAKRLIVVAGALTIVAPFAAPFAGDAGVLLPVAHAYEEGGGGGGGGGGDEGGGSSSSGGGGTGGSRGANTNILRVVLRHLFRHIYTDLPVDHTANPELTPREIEFICSMKRLRMTFRRGATKWLMSSMASMLGVSERKVRNAYRNPGTCA